MELYCWLAAQSSTSQIREWSIKISTDSSQLARDLKVQPLKFLFSKKWHTLHLSPPLLMIGAVDYIMLLRHKWKKLIKIATF